MFIRLFFILIIFTYLNTCFSQIILTTGDIPLPGDIQISARVDSLQDLVISPGEAGENIVWEFGWVNFYGGIYNTAADSVLWKHPAATQDAQFFPDADIAESTNWYLYHNWETHAISRECYYNYYYKDSLGLHLFGSSYPVNHFLTYNREIFPLLKYGDTLVNNSRHFYLKSSGITDSVFVTIVIDTIIADGWGIIDTPVDTYDAIRYYTKEAVRDSLYVDGAGQLLKFSGDNYYYKWYTKDMGFPVFQISKGILETQPEYQVSRFAMYLKRNTGIFNPGSEGGSAVSYVFPNPCSGKSRIIISDYDAAQVYTISVYDVTSALCLRIENNRQKAVTLPLANLKKGFYLFEISGNKGYRSTGKFIVTDN